METGSKDSMRNADRRFRRISESPEWHGMRKDVRSVRHWVAEVGLEYFCLDYVSKNGVSVTERNTHAPSICSFWVLSLFFVHPWLCFIEYLSSPCHVCFHILNIQLELDSHFISFYSTLPIKLILSHTFHTPPNYTNSEPPSLSTLHLYLESFQCASSVLAHSGNSICNLRSKYPGRDWR